MTRIIDLSCDLGEAADERQQQVEDSIWPLITSANVACGGHAGDERAMRYAIMMSLRHGVKLGAHPSYPDRENFGRRFMSLPAAALKTALADQLTALAFHAKNRLSHVKPHGALYNDCHHDQTLARTVAEAIAEFDPDLAVVSSADSALYRAAQQAGLPVIAEAFADRRYRPDGSLVPRSRAGALLLDLDEAASQALSIARSGTVIADDGMAIRIVFKTICIHGDMERSVERLQRIRHRLSSAGFAFGAPAR